MEVPFVFTTMARRGLLKPGSPVKLARQFDQLRRWGFSLAGELRQAAARDPGRIAIIDERRFITYGDLLDRSQRLARALRPSVPAGERVGLLCRNSIPMIETLVAVNLLGADPVLVNTGLSGPQLETVVRDQGLRMLVHGDDFTALPASVELIAESRLDAMIENASDDELAPPQRPGRTIVLTSGTTGVPKGARRPTPSGFGPLTSIIDRIPLHAGMRIMVTAPLFHTWGYAGLQIALALRATVVLRRKFEAAATMAAMVREECSALIAVPVMLQHLLEMPPSELRPPLKVVAVSGSALPGGLATRFMDRYGDVLYNLYGSTEVSWASIATPADLRAAPTTAGRPPHGTRVAIIDHLGRPAPTGEVGRVFVGNEMLFEGYTNGASREIHDGLLATGDLGHRDQDGRLFIDGREDDMIVSGGENVFPSEVEDLLAALPQIREVAVVGVPDEAYGQRLVAYVVLNPGAALDPDAVREHVRRHRARFCVPRDVVFLSALPRNATGKIVTRDLPR